MRRTLIVTFALSFLLVSVNSFAQSSTDATKKEAAAKAKADKKEAKEKAKADKTAAENAAKAKDVTNPSTTSNQKTTTKANQGVNKSADKAVGTDAKGRTIYEGPRGGRYTLTPAGNKEYIKKDK